APRLSLVINRETVEALDCGAAICGSSLQTSLLASYFLLLSRLTSASELKLGVNFDGRNYEELTSALGLFARFLPIHADLSTELSVSRLFSTLDASLADAARWQELFTHPSQGDGAAAFFPFCFEYEEESPAVGVGGTLRLSMVRTSAYISRFKLLLRCVRRADGSLLAEWHYDGACYDEDEVTRLVERWVRTIESLCEQPSAARPDEVEIVGDGELAELLRHGRGTAEEWDGPRCVHEIFAEQAARTPAAVAVVYEDESISYAELERRANQLARYLRGQGVCAEQRVGLLMERSVEMVVALLGILKAGGAYVPLEGSQPPERLARMVEDACARIVVTTSSLRGVAEALRAEREVYVDDERELIAQQSAERLEATASEDNVAYVIYTSGSTGSPKGVMISHRAICNRLLWMLKQFPMTADDSVLQKTPYNFDASIWEFFVPLFAGARLVMAQPEGHQDSAYLVEAIAAHGITTLQLVPSMLRIVLEEPGFDSCQSLRRVFCGGEALTAKIQEQFFARTGMELHNLYGPTETAIDATCWTFRADDASRAVIIGRPIANTEVYLLDAHLQPVPFGVGGELHVGGAGLARGYL
ncbi:MAG TPA: amino acid adenylation domain-containing protein, partial [Pyrinomonadaceae bacterium]